MQHDPQSVQLIPNVHFSLLNRTEVSPFSLRPSHKWITFRVVTWTQRARRCKCLSKDLGRVENCNVCCYSIFSHEAYSYSSRPANLHSRSVLLSGMVRPKSLSPGSQPSRNVGKQNYSLVIPNLSLETPTSLQPSMAAILSIVFVKGEFTCAGAQFVHHICSNASFFWRWCFKATTVQNRFDAK